LRKLQISENNGIPILSIIAVLVCALPHDLSCNYDVLVLGWQDRLLRHDYEVHGSPAPSSPRLPSPDALRYEGEQEHHHSHN